MKLLLSNKYENCVRLGKESMLSYFEENDIDWDFAERLKLYIKFELYEVIDDDTIGYMALRENESKLYLADIQILERFQNLGYGTKLLKYASDMAKSKGYDSIYLKVFKNSPALNLYLRNGYNHVSEEQYVYLLSAST